MYTSTFRRGGESAESGNQNLLHRSARLHGLADVGARIYGSGAEYDEEEKKMSEILIMTILSFCIGFVLGLAAGKTN